MGYKSETVRLHKYIIVDPTGNGKDELLDSLKDKYYILAYTVVDSLIHYVLEPIDFDYEDKE